MHKFLNGLFCMSSVWGIQFDGSSRKYWILKSCLCSLNEKRPQTRTTYPYMFVCSCPFTSTSYSWLYEQQHVTVRTTVRDYTNNNTWLNKQQYVTTQTRARNCTITWILHIYVLHVQQTLLFYNTGVYSCIYMMYSSCKFVPMYKQCKIPAVTKPASMVLLATWGSLLTIYANSATTKAKHPEDARVDSADTCQHKSTALTPDSTSRQRWNLTAQVESTALTPDSTTRQRWHLTAQVKGQKVIGQRATQIN